MMREQVEKTLSRIRVKLQADGGDVELVGVENGVVKVRLKGACGGCPMAAMTLRHVIEGMLKSEVPGVKAVEAVQ